MLQKDGPSGVTDKERTYEDDEPSVAEELLIHAYHNSFFPEISFEYWELLTNLT